MIRISTLLIAPLLFSCTIIKPGEVGVKRTIGKL